MKKSRGLINMTDSKIVKGTIEVMSEKTYGIKISGIWYNATTDNRDVISDFKKGDNVEIEYSESDNNGKKSNYIISITPGKAQERPLQAKESPLNDSSKIIRQSCLKSAAAFYSGMQYPPDPAKLFELAEKMETWVNR